MRIAISFIFLAGCSNDGRGTSADAATETDGAVDSGQVDAPAMVAPCAGADATDDFERATLGGAWMQWVNSQCSIANSSDLAQASTTNWCYAVYGTTFGANQFSEAVISSDKASNILTQVFVRQQPVGTPSGNGARYGFHYNADPGKAWWEIKYDGVVTADVRVWMNATAPAPAPGDRMRIEVTGTDPVIISGYHNGVEIISVTDTAAQRIAVTGHSGMVERNAMGTSAPSNNSPVFESWCGGDL